MLNFAAGNPITGYNLTRSLRFRASASASLSRTPATATNRTTWTWSAWVKRGYLGTGTQVLFGTLVGTSDATYTTIAFRADTLIVDGYTTNWRTSTQVFRDPSAYYHFVVALDTTQATAANRLKLYVNGVQITAFSTSNDPSLNQTLGVDNSSLHYIAQNGAFDGYLAEVNFIDGQALTPSSFGSTNSTTGVWQPAAYTGTYGTNGFYLPFTDNSALTTSSNVGLGKDFSGNANYWVTNNISITAGVTYDSMTDVPTLTSATAANFAVLNPLTGTNGTLSDGNLYFYGPGSYSCRMGTLALPSSGKIYFETKLVTGPFAPRGISTSYNWIGVALSTNFNITSGPNGNNVKGIMIGDNGYLSNFSSSITDTGTTFVVNDVIGIAIDTSANTYAFYKNNVSIASGTINVTAGTSLSPMQLSYDASNGAMKVNFGQQPFTYTPPSGYVALNVYNIPTSTILKGNTVMDATLYTGTLLSNAVVNAAAFKPDLVWPKSRSAATDNKLTDSVRGATKALVSNTNAAETTDTQGLTAFNTNGFTVGTDTVYNNLAATYVAWQWQAGQGSSSSNTNGTITSTVSVNASAGFSVATYTGTGANATIGHGLGVAPSMVITKNRGAVNSWGVYHSSLTSAAYFLLLNTNDAQVSGSTYWNSTAPTSSVFSVGTATPTNASANTYVAYCWAPISGFSAFGSYTGNGSTDGTFVYTGFRPKWIMIKRTDSTSDWYIWDTARDTYNVVTNTLLADTSGAETSATSIDNLSNGFKCRSATVVNASGGTYIYAAFAENPFRNALAR